MQDLIESGSQWLSGQLTAHAAKPVIYRRGEEAVNVRATKQQTEFEIDRNGLVETFVSMDFSFDAGELVLSEGQTTPEPGDRLWEMLPSGTTVVYEVLEPGGDRQCYELDAHRTRLTVHSKETETF